MKAPEAMKPGLARAPIDGMAREAADARVSPTAEGLKSNGRRENQLLVASREMPPNQRKIETAVDWIRKQKRKQKRMRKRKGRQPRSSRDSCFYEGELK